MWARAVSRCRMEAISLEPLSDVLPHVLATSPDAKFIMTMRPFPGWLQSFFGAMRRDGQFVKVLRTFGKSVEVLPWFQFVDSVTGQFKRMRQEANPFFGKDLTLTSLLYLTSCNGYGWLKNNIEERGTRKLVPSEEAYLAHFDEVRRTVPHNRLLE